MSFLASDVDADGGKLILTAGAPKGTGNDEERMLLALRKIVASDLQPIPSGSACTGAPYSPATSDRNIDARTR